MGDFITYGSQFRAQRLYYWRQLVFFSSPIERPIGVVLFLLWLRTGHHAGFAGLDFQIDICGRFEFNRWRCGQRRYFCVSPSPCLNIGSAPSTQWRIRVEPWQMQQEFMIRLSILYLCEFFCALRSLCFAWLAAEWYQLLVLFGTFLPNWNISMEPTGQIALTIVRVLREKFPSNVRFVCHLFEIFTRVCSFCLVVGSGWNAFLEPCWF